MIEIGANFVFSLCCGRVFLSSNLKQLIKKLNLLSDIVARYLLPQNEVSKSNFVVKWLFLSAAASTKRPNKALSSDNVT